MYSKNKYQSQAQQPRQGITPPPGYDGSRFRRRSDGRDESFPVYDDTAARKMRGESPHPETDDKAAPPIENEASENEAKSVCKTESKPLQIPFLSGIGKEELLIISLIIILAGEKNNSSSDIILTLALLLCIG